MTTSFFRLHSGGVVRNGLGVLFVGPSGSGKSTLVLRLLRDGFSLVSDDEVWIDPKSLMVHPSGRPLFLKDSAWDFFPTLRDKFLASRHESRAWWLDPDDIRANCRAAPSPVWGIIFLEPRETNPHSSSRPSLQELGQTEALARLLRESMNFPDFRSVGVSLLIEMTKSARLLKLNSGDLDDCGRMLTTLLP